MQISDIHTFHLCVHLRAKHCTWAVVEAEVGDAGDTRDCSETSSDQCKHFQCTYDFRLPRMHRAALCALRRRRQLGAPTGRYLLRWWGAAGRCATRPLWPGTCWRGRETSPGRCWTPCHHFWMGWCCCAPPLFHFFICFLPQPPNPSSTSSICSPPHIRAPGERS